MVTRLHHTIGMMEQRRTCVIWWAVATVGLVALGCNEARTVPGFADAGGTSLEIPDYGRTCPLSCNGFDRCAERGLGCANVCISSGLGGTCGQECAGGCPIGFRCEAAPGGGLSVCIEEPAVCGDGRLQRLEECDAGERNGTPGTMCQSDCTVPPPPGEVVRLVLEYELENSDFEVVSAVRIERMGMLDVTEPNDGYFGASIEPSRDELLMGEPHTAELRLRFDRLEEGLESNRASNNADFRIFGTDTGGCRRYPTNVIVLENEPGEFRAEFGGDTSYDPNACSPSFFLVNGTIEVHNAH